MTYPLRHSILGAGGVGGLMAACLGHLGASVTMIVRPGKLSSYPDEIDLQSTMGHFHVAVDRAAAVPECDVLWITIKATQLEDALQLITNPSKVRAMVPLLNGTDHVEVLRQKYGREKIMPGTIAGEMERIAPGQFVHSTPFCRLHLSTAAQPLLGETVEQLKNLGIECRFIENEATLMWGKLVFLAPFALSTTASGLTVGGMLSRPEWKELAEGCVREACAVAVAEGASVDANAVIAASGKYPPGMRSSMQKDVDQGNPPELDAIAGPILRGARRHGIEVPATEQLVSVIQGKSAAQIAV